MSRMVERRTIRVDGMSCGGCENAVKNALRTLDGVHRVDADHEAGTVEIAVKSDVSDDVLRTAIHDAGYEVVG